MDKKKLQPREQRTTYGLQTLIQEPNTSWVVSDSILGKGKLETAEEATLRKTEIHILMGLKFICIFPLNYCEC